MNGASNVHDVTSAPNGITTIASTLKELRPEETRDTSKQDKDSRNITIKIYKHYKLQIYKPLLLLKLALFIWYGAGSVVATFLLVFFKQRGLTLTEISTVYIITPAVQFIGPTISGIIADKIGRSKPVLVFNLLLTVLLVTGMLVAPSMILENCDPQPVNLKCHPQEFGRLIAKTSCDVSADIFHLSSCNVTCPENVTKYCHGQNLICEMLEGNEDFNNISLSVKVSWAYKRRTKCYYNVTSMSHKNLTYSWCNVPHKMYCRISCTINPDEDCAPDNSGRVPILILNWALLILFNTAFSNCYRFMDVTAMYLVKEHDSDYGRERFFSILGILTFSPIAGYIIDATTNEDEDRNYNTAFYLFIGMVFVLLAAIYKLKVQIKPPGKKMWRKSLQLLKNPDVIAFVFVLLVLGSAWGFTKNFTFWYLEGMKPPSFLLGLINAVSALYGLPFLLTSNWWVRKIGTTQIFIFGLLGYVIAGIGYSFLYDPWLALLIEVTTVLTYHLLWVAVIVHSHSIAPEGLTATVIAVAGGIHYSLGKGSGGFIGGFIMNAYGGRMAYTFFAIVCLTSAVLYSVYLYIRKSCFSGRHEIPIKNGAETITYNNEDTGKEIYVMKEKY